jgi:hypothetical protein
MEYSESEQSGLLYSERTSMIELLKSPYLQKDEMRGDYQVWIVDGAYIRGHIDEEFTNFGQHYRYPYIPEKEFWIDQEAQHDERAFFIEHLLVEHDLMAKGASYADALTQANHVERRERRRAGDLRKVTHQGKELPDAGAIREILWKKLENGVSVWVVNGRLVRSAFDIDFTAGGHDHVYEFVPEGEIWMMMPSKKRKGDSCSCTNCTNAIAWQPACPTAQPMQSPAAWSITAVTIRMSYMMHWRLKAGHDRPLADSK